MLNAWQSGIASNCAGITRRDVLRIGTLSLGGLTMGEALRARAEATQSGRAGKQTAAIAFWLDGGPTHMDTYDPKMQAPAEYRGPFNSISTNVPGIELSQLCMEQAKLMDRLAVVRSLHHDNGDHYAAAHWMWTGYLGSTAANLDPMYPSLGAIVSKVRGPNHSGVPPFVAVPYAATIGLRPGYQSAAYLGASHNPFEANSDPNSGQYKVPNLNLAGGLTIPRLSDRRGLLGRLDRIRRDADRSRLMNNIDSFNGQAFEMLTGERARLAFDINQEPAAMRDRYGRTSVGQSALLARRLVEAGVTFVSIHYGGWDMHGNIEPAMKNLMPPLDRAVASLVSDLCERGMFENVVVLVMGEFGRTPRVNGSAGRDHWGGAISALLGGGGIRGGQVVGATDAKGQYPIQHPVKPAHLLATLYKLLGVNPHGYFTNNSGRPIPILGEGEPIDKLV